MVPSSIHLRRVGLSIAPLARASKGKHPQRPSFESFHLFPLPSSLLVSWCLGGDPFFSRPPSPLRFRFGEGAEEVAEDGVELLDARGVLGAVDQGQIHLGGDGAAVAAQDGEGFAA